MSARIGVLVGARGRGSNMVALIEANLGISLVVSPSNASPALERAQYLGVETRVVLYQPEDTFGARLSAAFDECDLICLAGFLRKVPREVLEKKRTLNIHPALLPKFGGQGMYGHHVHEAVLASGERESGCSVHWVTEEYDEGAVVTQLRCAVEPNDTADSLAARVLNLEHQAYPAAVRLVLGMDR